MLKARAHNLGVGFFLADYNLQNRPNYFIFGGGSDIYHSRVETIEFTLTI